MNTLDFAALHRELIERLDAFVDDELTPAEAERMRAHLSGCRRCQQALRLQRALRDRLAALPVPRAPGHLSARIQDRLKEEPRARDQGALSGAYLYPSLRRAAPWLGWALAAGIAALSLASRPWDKVKQQLPMVQAALADYRLHQMGQIPATDPQQLSVLAQNLPFEAHPLPALRAQLIGAWQTTIRGEPAAAFAYRYQTHLLVQYVVSQSLFFHQPRLREAVSRNGRYTTTEREIAVLAWPQKDSGSILVGAVDPHLLEAISL